MSKNNNGARRAFLVTHSRVAITTYEVYATSADEAEEMWLDDYRCGKIVGDETTGDDVTVTVKR